MQTVRLKPPVAIALQNHLDGSAVTLRSFDASFPLSEARVNELIAACNEGHIYNWLFAEKLSGRKYGKAEAISFADFATKGWQENSWYVFLVQDAQSKIMGALDIKSAKAHDAEIGYWLSTKGRGIMTNAVKALCEYARAAGFKSLIAKVRPGNEKSSGVLLRAGFSSAGEEVENEIVYSIFRNDLSAIQPE